MASVMDEPLEVLEDAASSSEAEDQDAAPVPHFVAGATPLVRLLLQPDGGAGGPAPHLRANCATAAWARTLVACGT